MVNDAVICIFKILKQITLFNKIKYNIFSIAIHGSIDFIQAAAYNICNYILILIKGD